MLGEDKPDEDAKTRGQQQKIEEIKEEKPARKGRLAKGVTMIGTAKVHGLMMTIRQAF